MGATAKKEVERTFGERLEEARTRAGFRSARAFAMAKKIPVSTYIMHESGDRQIYPEVAEKYARMLDVNPSWLVFEGADREPVQIVRPRLPVVGEIRADAFVDLNKYNGRRHDDIQIPHDHQYPIANQCAYYFDDPEGEPSYVVCLCSNPVEIAKGMTVVIAVPRKNDSSLHEILLGVVKSSKGRSHQIATERGKMNVNTGSSGKKQVRLLGRALFKLTPL